MTMRQTDRCWDSEKQQWIWPSDEPEGTMTRAQFHNALRILASIDRDEVPFLDDRQWVVFVANPSGFFIRCDDPTCDSLWAVIQRRTGAAL